MKKIKQTNLKYLLAGILFLPFIFSSCTEEWFNDYDIRNDIIGDYDYELKVYLEDGRDLVYIGDEPDLYDVTGSMWVEKHPEYNDMIRFYDSEGLLFEGMNIREVDNAIVFDIPEQEFWLGPIPVTIAGYEYWDVGASSYHGAFLYEDESVEIAFAARIMDVSNDLVMILVAFK